MTAALTSNCSPTAIISKIPRVSFSQVLKKDLTVGLKSEHSSSGQGMSSFNSSHISNASLKSVGSLGSTLKKRKVLFSILVAS